MKKSIFTLLLPLLLTGCANEDEPVMPETESRLTASAEAAEVFPGGSVIDNMIAGVLHKDKSRSGYSYTVTPIAKSRGASKMLAVNLDDNGGFLVISADSTHYPVLAFSETGHYGTDEMTKPFGVKLWEEDMLLEMAAEKSREEQEFISNEWKKYKSSPVIAAATAQTNSSVFQEMQDSIKSWVAKGYLVEEISNPITGNPSEDETMREFVMSEVYYAVQDEWEKYAYIVTQNTETVTSNYLVKSTWGQEGYYNAAYPILPGTDRHAYAGCVPVAFGQIFRYFRNPLRMPWTDMPLTYGTLVTSQFLYDIAETGHASYNYDGTPVSPLYFGLIINKYGYTYTPSSQYKAPGAYPDIVVGSDLEQNAHHAWIRDGSSTTVTVNRKDVRYLHRPGNMQSINVYNNSHTIFRVHYNWGYYGQYDGFFKTSDFQCGSFNYNTNVNYYLNVKPTNLVSNL